MLLRFSQSISHIQLPERFTFPFHYTPHPLCVIATEEIKTYIASQEQWADELSLGKMFGVLVVATGDGEIGYLAAFSGNLAGKNLHPNFVPPVYDLLHPEGFFIQGELEISAINERVSELQKAPAYIHCKGALEDAKKRSVLELECARESMRLNRQKRKKRREENPDDAEMIELARQSVNEKKAFKQLDESWKLRILELQKELDAFNIEIETLKRERKSRSAALQLRIFDRFRMLNAFGEPKGIPAIFECGPNKMPPAGAGECAGPKLLQYAYQNGLKPLAMAEFWWGNSPKSEVRHHGHYYPACNGKCEPILGHMLIGLEVDPNPLLEDRHRDTELEIVYEDAYLLVVNKPEGMLSVPGKSDKESVVERIAKMYPEASGPLIVHRLDMATSGLLLIAKDKEIHKQLQALFEDRSIKKRYTAVLEGIVAEDKGVINLPLCLNPLDRPRQMVSEEYGKLAITRFEVLERKANRTRVAFYPHTGRTHQLRMHASHKSGLNCPIVGDELYGTPDTRLHLHAEMLKFKHPVTGKTLTIEKKADF